MHGLTRTLRLTGVLGVAGCLHTLGCCEDLPKQYWLGWRVIAAGSVGFALIVVDILLGARRFNRAWQNELGRASLAPRPCGFDNLLWLLRDVVVVSWDIPKRYIGRGV